MEEKWRDLALSFRYEKDVLSRWMRQSAGQRKRSTVYMLILALLAVNFIIAAPTAQHRAAPVAMAALCIALLIFVFAVSRGRRSADTVEELYRGGEEYRVFLRADGFSYRAGAREETVPYGADVRIAEHDDYFALRYGKDGVLILPKAAMTDAQSVDLSDYYREKFPRAYKRHPR